LTDTVVLIPFKADRRKSRLSRVLDVEGRRQLAGLMLLDVLRAFRGASLLSSCYVVTSDVDAMALARGAGARFVAERRDEGVNAAVRTGVKALGRDHDYMVMPSDLPLLVPAEINCALAWRRRFDCVISPSISFDGTNLLLFSGNSAPVLSYDSNSFWNHIHSAAQKRLSLVVYCGKGVLYDVDTPEDLLTLSKSKKRTPSILFAREALAKRQS